MAAFSANQLKILVATTVIEVGVNVPNANIMVIEHAERFGLAQLHQLRGRVGRGTRESFCMLLYKAPLGETAKARLEMMEKTEDGFLIAEKDLELRGGGEVLGARQSGAAGVPRRRGAGLRRCCWRPPATTRRMILASRSRSRRPRAARRCARCSTCSSATKPCACSARRDRSRAVIPGERTFARDPGPSCVSAIWFMGRLGRGRRATAANAPKHAAETQRHTRERWGRDVSCDVGFRPSAARPLPNLLAASSFAP